MLQHCSLPDIDDGMLKYDLYYRILKSSSTSGQETSSSNTTGVPNQEEGRTISGSVVGLFSIGLRIRNSDGKETTLNPGDTSFQLTNTRKGSYLVSVQRQALSQRCTISNDFGNSESSVTDLVITCSGVGEAGIGLWDTGVTQCFTNLNSSSGVCPNSLFPRQDGDSAPIFTRSFTVRADGNIKDNITGLIWKPCIAGLSGSNCTVGSATTSSFSTAQTKCGPSPWRVPSSKELMSIIDFTNPTYGVVSQFPFHPAGYYLWTKEDFGSQSHALNITTGAIEILSKFNTTVGHVQCVNDSEIIQISNTFTDLSNGIIREEISGLEWEKCVDGLSGTNCTVGTYSSQNWQNSLSYCANLNLGGYTDWRMPNINELTSILDYTRFASATMLDPIFVGSPYQLYHSSTTLGNGNIHAGSWVSSVGNFPYYAGSFQNNSAKSLSNPTRCVRGPTVL